MIAGFKDKVRIKSIKGGIKHSVQGGEYLVSKKAVIYQVSYKNDESERFQVVEVT